MKKLVCAVLLLSLIAVAGYCLSGTIVGTQVNITYQEPNTNEDGTTLDDLAKTTVYYQVQGSTFSVVGATVTATSTAGNGIINTSVTLPMITKKALNYNIWATATDLSNNESVPSNVIVERVDKLAPAAPK